MKVCALLLQFCWEFGGKRNWGEGIVEFKPPLLK